MLPVEILAHVSSCLDPTSTEDRLALTVLARANSTMYPLAMKVLYRTVTLNDVSMMRFLASGHHISKDNSQVYEQFIGDEEDLKCREGVRQRWGHLPPPTERWRRSLGFIRHLTIESPVWEKNLCMMWETCEPDVLLFPHVESLRFREREHAGRQPEFKEAPDPTEVFFDCPDLCVTDKEPQALVGALPSRDMAYRNVTYHGPTYASSFPRNIPMPRSWTTFRCFEWNPGTARRAFPSAKFMDRNFSAVLDVPGVVQLCVAVNKPGFPRRIRRRREEEAAATARAYERLKSPYREKIELCFGDVRGVSPPECPPCIVCGLTWTKNEPSEMDAIQFRCEEERERGLSPLWPAYQIQQEEENGVQQEQGEEEMAHS